MPINRRKLPSFEGVAAGQTATLRCPIGESYHGIDITYSGVTLAQMKTIRVIANGEVIQTISGGDRLDFLNRFDGRAAAAGVLVIDFERYGLKTRAGIEATVLGTGDPNDPLPVTTLAVEVDIDAAAVNPVLKATARRSEPSPSGLLRKFKEFTYSASAAGVFEISDIPKGPLINRVFFGGHTANVYKSLTVERDNFILFEQTVAELEAEQIDGIRVPQADFVVFDPSAAGYGSEALVTQGVSDLRFKLDVTNAGQIPVIVEYLDSLTV